MASASWLPPAAHRHPGMPFKRRMGTSCTSYDIHKVLHRVVHGATVLPTRGSAILPCGGRRSPQYDGLTSPVPGFEFSCTGKSLKSLQYYEHSQPKPARAPSPFPSARRGMCHARNHPPPCEALRRTRYRALGLFADHPITSQCPPLSGPVRRRRPVDLRFVRCFWIVLRVIPKAATMPASVRCG